MSATLNQPSIVIGLMSGTSVDAVDACASEFSIDANGSLKYNIVGTYSLPMPQELREKLLASMGNQSIRLSDICSLNVEIGELFAQAALGLVKHIGLKVKQVSCIGSHGQTLYHLPPGNPLHLAPSTFQIGEPSIIAERTGITTIADFRPRDMAAGGHGAPLVSFADSFLFQDLSLGRCIQNIGGISNVTVLPPKNQGEPIAFDTGPGNMLIDGAMQLLFNQPYDEDGDIASAGWVDKEMLAELMAHPYLKQTPPKTTGREQFGKAFLEELMLRFVMVHKENVMATVTQFTAQSIVNAYEDFIFPFTSVHEVILGGGGVYNKTLVDKLKCLFSQSSQPQLVIKTHDDFGIPSQYKEALAFALLAWCTQNGIPNTLPSCTGATHPVILGKIIPK